MGLEPKRPGNRGIVMGRLYEGNRPLRHPLLPRIYPWIYPTRVRRCDDCQVRQTDLLQSIATIEQTLNA
jgi:hypothetical protein